MNGDLYIHIYINLFSCEIIILFILKHICIIKIEDNVSELLNHINFLLK